MFASSLSGYLQLVSIAHVILNTWSALRCNVDVPTSMSCTFLVYFQKEAFVPPSLYLCMSEIERIWYTGHIRMSYNRREAIHLHL